VAGARRKKSHADGSSLFQWLEHRCWTKQFQSAPAAGKKTGGNSELIVTRETGPHKSEPRGTKIDTESLARSGPAFARKKL